MTLHISIEYRTRWGEQLTLRIGQRRIALQYAEGGTWHGTLARFDPAAAAEYTYEVERDGQTVRREWQPHTLRLPEGFRSGTLCIRDRWQGYPADRPFRSSAFTRGIFAREASPQPDRKATSEAAPAVATAPEAGGNALLRVVVADLHPDKVLCIAGSSPSLGGWSRVVPMDDSRFPVWELPLDVKQAFEYKFLIADRRTLTPVLWEEGPNRLWAEVPGKDTLLIDERPVPRFPERQWRGAGTAIPVFSLRSEEDFGIGEFRDLKRLADWAAATGQRILQLLPVNDTTMSGTWQDSYPYNANSTFALHPQYLHLPDAGVEVDEEYLRLREELNALVEVDYVRVNREKRRLLHRAFERDGAETASRPDYTEFVDRNRSWLMPYAAFCTLRDRFGTAEFSRWGEYARYDEQAVEAFSRAHESEIAYHCFVQYHLDRQLTDVRRYAHSRGVVLKGDLPIGISRTSVDAWRSPDLFHMDSQAGAPPDAFSALGQNWGFPTYDWERMAQDGFAWWRARMQKMAAYFDAFRIDHILGFFRIWEIPTDALHGLLGHFNPALPYSADELRALGFDNSDGRYTTPPLDDAVLTELFGELAAEVRTKYTFAGRLLPAYTTQRKVVEQLPGDDAQVVRIRDGLLALLDDVLFVEDPRRKGFYHPRIGAQTTYAYRQLDDARREAFNRLHDDFFYRRHNAFWKESALSKLPALLAATDMLACGEDLGMIPDSVPETMRALQVLSLEIQRMPKTSAETFADPARYPYLSVCTTSTHDMNPLRAWWEEDRALTARFYREVLGEQGEAPAACEPWICRRIVGMHLASPAIFAILPLQDWLAMDGALRSADPQAERINIPAVPRYHWRYRMHLTLEELQRTQTFSAALHAMIADSGRR